jgi:hypothetical protein
MSNTDALTGKLLEIINQVQGAVSAHSGEAVSFVLISTRIDGIFFLVVCFIGWAFFAGLTLIPFSGKASKKEIEELFGFLLITGALSLLFLAILIYPWNWIQVFNPKLYLAHEIIGKVLN